MPSFTQGVCRLAAMVCAAMPLTAWPQAYPAKPVRLVVPIVPGGSVDLIARRFAQKMSDSMGQPMVVENIAGASGTIGATQVSKATPDGYTIMWATVGETIVYLFMSRNRPYDALRDFTPIMAAVSGISVLAAHPSTPGNTLKEVIEHAKAHPGKLAYGSAGIGSYFHMTAELFKSVAGIDLLHVPYKGVPPALNGLAAGQVQLMFVSIASSTPFKSRLKTLAVVESKRYPGLPDVPAITEFVPNFEKLPTYYAFFGPAGLPRLIVTRLNDEANKALRAPDMRDYLDSVGFLSLGGTPEDLGSMHRDGIEIYGQAARLSGLKPE